MEVDENWWKIWKNRRYLLSIMVCLGIVTSFAARTNFSVAIVVMSEEPEFNWSLEQKGYLLAAFYYGYTAMQIPFGIILKWIPAYYILSCSVFACGVLTALTPIIAKYFYVLLTFRMLLGVFQAAVYPCIFSFMTVWAPLPERSRLTQICVSGGFIGTVSALTMSGLIGELYGWPWIFYFFAIVSFLWCLLWVAFIRITPEKDNFISTEELTYITSSIENKTERKNLQIPWKAFIVSVPVWSLTATIITWGWGFVTMLTQLPTYLKDVGGFDLAQNGFLSSLPYIMMTLMSWLAGYIADLLLLKGISVNTIRKSFICVGLVLQAIFIVISAYVLIPAVNILCISFAIGVGAFTFGGISSNPMDLAPEIAPFIAAFGNTFTSLVGSISPVLTGYVVTADSSNHELLKWQWQLIFLICSGIYVTGSIVYLIGGSARLQPWAKSVVSDNNEIT